MHKDLMFRVVRHVSWTSDIEQFYNWQKSILVYLHDNFVCRVQMFCEKIEFDYNRQNNENTENAIKKIYKKISLKSNSFGHEIADLSL